MPAGSKEFTAASTRAGERPRRHGPVFEARGITGGRLPAASGGGYETVTPRQPFFGGVNLIFRISSTIWPFSSLPDTAVIALTTLAYLRA